jgi:peptide-methionine (S)-S-oxide reductase
MGPPEAVSNPSYEAVCRGDTGHVEVVHLQFDPSKASYEDVVRFFYTFHDPTTLNKQGNDRGTQYASAIFYHNEEQRKVAERVTQELQSKLDQKTLKFSGRPFTESKVSTAILPATTFFPAETYHQRYLEKNPGGYCNHSIRFKWSSL